MGKLVNAHEFLANVQDARMCYIGGKLGKGKTSLAVRIAQEFLERDYRLITNIRCVWNDVWDDVNFLDEFGHLKAVVIIDEGGAELKSTAMIERSMQYLAKMDLIVLMPSKSIPVRSFKSVECEVMYSWKPIGIPLVRYRWKSNESNKEDGGTFLWWNPNKVYGIYSRQDPGASFFEVAEWLVERAERYRELWGRNDGVSAMEIPEVELIREAVEEQHRANEDAAALLARERRQRRSRR